MRVLSIAPDGTYAYGTSLADAQNNLKNIGGDGLLAIHYQVNDTHIGGKVTIEAVQIKHPVIKHV
jgi:hypothetical protein